MRVSKAVRKASEEITVLQVTEDNLRELIEKKVLNEHGNRIDPSRNKNPSQVNIGDYIRIDDMNDIYPINTNYFDQNFRILREEDANIGDSQS